MYSSSCCKAGAQTTVTPCGPDDIHGTYSFCSSRFSAAFCQTLGPPAETVTASQLLPHLSEI